MVNLKKNDNINAIRWILNCSTAEKTRVEFWVDESPVLDNVPMLIECNKLAST